jgi:hypothetical protein
MKESIVTKIFALPALLIGIIFPHARFAIVNFLVKATVLNAKNITI